jgi:general secretion pathway protein A
VVLDEAHLLSSDTLTDLRLLISSALDVGPALKLLLVGQESLRGTLKRAQHADLLNRLSVRYQLRPLSKDQTTQYLDFQLTQAGGDGKVFGPEVKDLIHDFTGGLPRAINNLAIACLVQARALGVARVDEKVFHQAAGEFQFA